MPEPSERHHRRGGTVFYILVGGVVLAIGFVVFGVVDRNAVQPAGEVIDTDGALLDTAGTTEPADLDADPSEIAD